MNGIKLSFGEDMLDDDILEIFAEEAHEVFDTIAEHLPLWAGDFDNRTALQELRRAFHTLKGSGRMVKAKVIADVALVVEQMLNRVIEGTLAANTNMVILLEHTQEALKPLVDQFQSRIEAEMTLDLEQIISQAKALTKGEVIELSHDLPVLGAGGIAVGGHEMEILAAGGVGQEQIAQLDKRMEELNSRLYSIDMQLSEQSDSEFDIAEIQKQLLQLDTLNEKYVARTDLEEMYELIDSVGKDNQEMRYFLNANNNQVQETLNSFSDKNQKAIDSQLQAVEQKMADELDAIHNKLLYSQLLAVAAIAVAAVAIALPML